MRSLTTLFFALGLGTSLLACANETKITTYENEGRICVNAHPMMGETGELGAGEKALIRVHMHECLSSSCDRLLHVECAVELIDGVLVLESSGAVEDLRGPRTGCTDDCGFMVAQCETPPLAEGEYTLRHGDREITLSVPSTDIACPL